MKVFPMRAVFFLDGDISSDHGAGIHLRLFLWFKTIDEPETEVGWLKHGETSVVERVGLYFRRFVYIDVVEDIGVAVGLQVSRIGSIKSNSCNQRFFFKFRDEKLTLWRFFLLKRRFPDSEKGKGFNHCVIDIDLMLKEAWTIFLPSVELINSGLLAHHSLSVQKGLQGHHLAVATDIWDHLVLLYFLHPPLDGDSYHQSFLEERDQGTEEGFVDFQN